LALDKFTSVDRASRKRLFELAPLEKCLQEQAPRKGKVPNISMNYLNNTFDCDLNFLKGGHELLNEGKVVPKHLIRTCLDEITSRNILILISHPVVKVNSPVALITKTTATG
jgi:hypothetical protein